MKLYSDYGDTAENLLPNSVVEPDGIAMVELIGHSATYGYGAIMASGPNSVATADFGMTSNPNYVGPVLYALPNPANGPWYKVADYRFLPKSGYYVADSSSPNPTSTNPNVVAFGDIRKAPRLTVGEGECTDTCEKDFHGTVSLGNGKKYYIGPHYSVENGELVEVSPNPNVGHITKGLKVSDGSRVWVKTGGGSIENYLSLAGLALAEPNTEGLYDQYPIYIEMAADAEVTPVFKRTCRILVVSGTGHQSNAVSAASGIGASYTLLIQPTEEDVLSQLPCHDVFVFFGHGSPDALFLDDESPYPQLTPQSVSATLSENSSTYKLVYLMACETANEENGYGDTWMSAFNAEAYVGFDQWISIYGAVVFDQLYWEEIVKGRNSLNAAYVAYGRLPAALRPGMAYPVAKGSVYLP